MRSGTWSRKCGPDNIGNRFLYDTDVRIRHYKTWDEGEQIENERDPVRCLLAKALGANYWFCLS